MRSRILSVSPVFAKFFKKSPKLDNHDFHVNVLPKFKKIIFKKIDLAYVKIMLIDNSWLNQVQIIYSIHVT